MSVSPEAVSKLLLTLYEAPMLPERWQTFVTDFARLLGLPAVAISNQHLEQKDYQFAVSYGIDPAAVLLYEQHFGRLDPYWPRFSLLAAGEVTFGEQLCPTSQLLRTEFFNDFVATTGGALTIYASVATVKRTDSLQVLTLYEHLRNKATAPYATDVLQAVIPHVRAALRLQQHCDEIAQSQLGLELGFEALNLAVLLLDECGACVFVSRKADRLLARGHGIQMRNGRLAACLPIESAAIAALIARTIATATRGALVPGVPVVVSHSGKPLLRVSATALSRSGRALHGGGGKEMVAAVFLRELTEAPRSQSLPALLSLKYGLTPAEARIAVELLAGCSLAESAKTNQVSVETVRVQVKAIYAKTGVHRQAALVRLLSELAAIA